MAVESLVYSGEGEGGYSWKVLRARRLPENHRLVVVGRLGDVDEGLEMKVRGAWTEHPHHGRQFQVTEAEILPPSTRAGVAKYLASGAIKGVGPKLAERILAHLGKDALERIAADPGVLRRVPGIGAAKAETVARAIRDQAESRDALVFLRGLGLGEALSRRVWKAYGPRTVEAIRTNPYRLAREVIGLGFRTADRLARGLGIAADSPFRIQAGVVHTLREAAGEGHSFLPENEVCHRTGALLKLDPEMTPEALAALQEEDQVRILAGPTPEELGPAVYPTLLARAEETLAARVGDLLARPRPERVPVNLRQALDREAAGSRLTLEGEQLLALERGLVEPLSIITGGPGVGKTTLVRVLVSTLQAAAYRVVLAAPTGRAARRLAEVTGLEAATIHRTLGYNPHRHRFEHDRRNPVEADVLVVDEVSMVDIQLAADLFQAVGGRTRVVLVGDADQLPSVGPGNVLGDLVRCGRIPLTRLTRVFRQRERGLIVENAHRILHGVKPETAQGPTGDFYFIPKEDPAAVREMVLRVVTERIPDAFGLDPIEGVQVLVPMYRGEAGADRLNRDLQEALVPPGPSLERGEYAFRRGDKVLQIRNDYDRELFNGDVGRVARVHTETGRLEVDFDGRVVECGGAELDQLLPAFAMSVHRAQGSEFPAVVIPLVTGHFLLLERHLFYTAVTRARRLVVLVGSERALELALSGGEGRKRWSGLGWRLGEAPGQG